MTPSMARTIAVQKATAPKVTPYRSANIVYKTTRKNKRKYGKRPVVAKPYRQAYNMLQPSKEKRFDFTDLAMFTNGTLSARTEYLQLDNISQDTDANSRLGSQIHMSYVHLKGTLTSNELNKTKALRFLIFREVNLGGFDPATMNYLFKGVGGLSYAPIGTQQDQIWPLNRELVQPIFDKRVVIPPENYSLKFINYKIRINKKVRYSPMVSTATSPYHGRLFLVVLLSDCDNTTTATTVALSLGVRIFFKDGRKAR